MSDNTKPSSSGKQRKGDPARPGLSGALDALREATRALASTYEPLAPTAATGGTPSAAGCTPPDLAATPATGEPRDRPSGSPAPPDDPDARAFHEHLEQTGQLADVTDATDLSSLPPRVTHVRWPDGGIERIGFSAY